MEVHRRGGEQLLPNRSQPLLELARGRHIRRGKSTRLECGWARALRIYPALWVMLGLTVFGLAPALTTLPIAEYFRAPRTYDYVWRCATLIGGVRYSLPGVFETNPLKGEFNG